MIINECIRNVKACDVRLVRLVEDFECPINVLAENCDSELGAKLSNLFARLERGANCRDGQFSDIFHSFVYKNPIRTNQQLMLD